MRSEPVLVTGATGYVGGRLTPRLLQSGYRVRAVGRSLSKLRCRPWASHPNVELAQADMLDVQGMTKAASGCWAAFYLVHSMNPSNKDYTTTDRRAAETMVAASAAAGLERIIYLGGIIPKGKNLSRHLASRAEVGKVLQSGITPTTWLRAAMILGSGSASFELLRYLADRLPLMITPLWVRTKVQPIAIANVLSYLEGCLETDEVLAQSLDIGGPDITNYADLFHLYARLAGLPKRTIIPVPFFSPKLSSYWVHLFTPVHASLARPLAEGLSNEVVVSDDRIRRMIPQDLISCEEAIGLALERIRQQQVETCWIDAGDVLPPEWIQCGDAPYAGGTVLAAAHRIRLQARPEDIWKVVSGLGGENGWYFANSLWWLRGAIDKLLGGVGLRRGRRHPVEIETGDALDFWRVLEARPSHRLLLLAEMKLPGQAVLEFRVEPAGEEVSELQLILRFLPAGLTGILYWKLTAPFHRWLYQGMLTGLARQVNQPLVSQAESFETGPPQSCRL